jgi:hypothetical protein
MFKFTKSYSKKGGCGCNKDFKLFGGKTKTKKNGILKTLSNVFKSKSKRVRFSKHSRTFKIKNRN